MPGRIKKTVAVVLSFILIAACWIPEMSAAPGESPESNFSDTIAELYRGGDPGAAFHNMQNDYSALDGIECGDELRALLDAYCAMRGASFTGGDIQSDNFSEAVVSDDAARRKQLASSLSSMGITVTDAVSRIRVDSVSSADSVISMEVYEWIHCSYTEKGFADVMGYGVNHSISAEMRGDRLIISRDCYYEDTLTLFYSSDYPVPEEPADDESENGFTVQAPSFFSLENGYTALAAEKYTVFCAVDYSDAFWQSYNPAYGNYNSVGGDCANFASQCMLAGGLQMVYSNIWYWRSYSDYGAAWISSTNQKNFMSAYYGAEIINPDDSQVLAGNPVYYGNGSNYAHTAFCVGTNEAGTPIVNAHNNDRYHVPWTLGTSWAYRATVQLGRSLVSRPSDPGNPFSYPMPTRNISQTSSPNSGSDVKFMEAALAKLGYSISVDGVFSAADGQVARAFQSANGLAADGILGAASRTKILELLAAQSSKAPTWATLSLSSASVSAGVPLVMNLSGDRASSYTVHITDSFGNEISSQTVSDGSYSVSTLTDGKYHAYVTATNDAGSVDSTMVPFTVTGKAESLTLSSKVKFNSRGSANITLTNNVTGEILSTEVGFVSGGAEFSITAMPGSYTLVVSKAGHTSYIDRSFELGADIIPPLIELYAGDVVGGDNSITLLDASTFVSCYGKRSTDAGFNSLCDFDGDGIVSLMDASALVSGYGKRGTELS